MFNFIRSVFQLYAKTSAGQWIQEVFFVITTWCGLIFLMFWMHYGFIKRSVDLESLIPGLISASISPGGAGHWLAIWLTSSWEFLKNRKPGHSIPLTSWSFLYHQWSSWPVIYRTTQHQQCSTLLGKSWQFQFILPLSLLFVYFILGYFYIKCIHICLPL
jgi:hypothetical protein